MSRFQNQITINASIEKVWGILADVESVQHYNQLVKTVKRTSENKEGLGASRHCDFHPNGFAKERVIVFEPKKQISFELIDSSWPVKNMKWHTRLTNDGSSTVLSQDMEYEVKYGPLGKILDALVMKKKMHQTIEELFVNLKKYIEKK